VEAAEAAEAEAVAVTVAVVLEVAVTAVVVSEVAVALRAPPMVLGAVVVLREAAGAAAVQGP
jgi:hypothetical protein